MGGACTLAGIDTFSSFFFFLGFKTEYKPFFFWKGLIIGSLGSADYASSTERSRWLSSRKSIWLRRIQPLAKNMEKYHTVLCLQLSIKWKYLIVFQRRGCPILLDSTSDTNSAR